MKSEKRRESLPEILRKPHNTDTFEKLNTGFYLEDKSKCSLLTKSSQINNLNLKTVSAESLRSISPAGSDSVFYSDPSNRVTLSPRCTRCNNEVNVNYTNNANNTEIIDIVKPPDGFGDSPEEPSTYVNKMPKRYRPEERRKNDRSEQIRAKSEERVKNFKEKRR